MALTAVVTVIVAVVRAVTYSNDMTAGGGGPGQAQPVSGTIPVTFGAGFSATHDRPPSELAQTHAVLTLGTPAAQGHALFTANVSSPSVARVVRVSLDGRDVTRLSIPPDRLTYVQFAVPPSTGPDAVAFDSTPAAPTGGKTPYALLFTNVVVWPSALISNPGAPNGDLVVNGGFETDTSGWGAAPPNTIVRSTAQARSGEASGLATRDTTTPDDDVANFHMTLETGKKYVVSYWIFIPRGFSGSGALLNPEWVGVTGEGSAAAIGILGQWQRVQGTFKLGTNASGFLVLRLPGTKSGDFVYIDDVSVRQAA